MENNKSLKQIMVISDVEMVDELSLKEIRGGGLFECCFINSACNKNAVKDEVKEQ